VPPPDFHPEFDGPILEDLDDALLRRRQAVDRAVLEQAQVQAHRGEHEVGRVRLRRPRHSAEALVQPSAVDHFHDLAEQSVRFRLLARRGQAFQHDRTDPGQG